MNYDLVRLHLEKQITKELYEQFDAEIIMQVLEEAKVENDPNHIRAILDGHSFKITKSMFGTMYDLCTRVIKALDFDEKIDFYISNDMESNCFAVYNEDKNQNHVIVMNSGIVEKFDAQEIMFIIGHEIGHLISRNAKLNKLIDFIFPDRENIPVIFMNKISLWNQLSELTADRFGYIASPDFKKCVSLFFKLASGLDLDKLNFNTESYLKEIDILIRNMKENPVNLSSSHPVNPIRIKSLELFSMSELYLSIKDGNQIEDDEELNKSIMEYLALLINTGTSGLDIHRKYFIASGGLLVASADKNMAMEEVNHIITILAKFTTFPKQLFDEVLSAGEDIQEIFNQSIANILSANPGERHSMFTYLIEIATADNEILKPEIEILFQIGQNIFDFERKEIAQMIADKIRSGYIPKILK